MVILVNQWHQDIYLLCRPEGLICQSENFYISQGFRLEVLLEPSEGLLYQSEGPLP